MEVITTYPHESVFLKQNELCEKSEISKPIFIFCFRKLGYSDYLDFQDSIRDFYASQINSYQASEVALKEMKPTEQLIKAAMGIERTG